MDFLIIYWCFTVNPILLDKTIKEYDFAEILKKSICLEQSTQAWCENCGKYQPTVSDPCLKMGCLFIVWVDSLMCFFPPLTICRCRLGTSAAFLMYWSLTVRWTVSKRLSSGRLRQRWASNSNPNQTLHDQSIRPLEYFLLQWQIESLVLSAFLS